MMRILVLAAMTVSPPVADDASDYASLVAPILTKYCAGCHNDVDREGEFSLETFASLKKGTPHGPAFQAGDGSSSRMIRQLTGQAKPAMPPRGEPRPTEAEIATLKGWIDAGAPGPKGDPADRMALVVPKIASKATARPVTALDASRDGRWLATARYGVVDLSGDGPPRTIGEFPGKVTAVHFTADGNRLVTASGVAGLGGVAAIWDVADGSLVRRFPGHRDLLFDAELSPDGKVLATCGYDRVIRLWDAVDGRPLRELAGHNGAVYDVSFSPDGRSLVSASADDTCKVWRVEDGTRLDTLPQPLKEEYACTFSPDGKTIVAGGADNTIRVWEVASKDKPGINPMILARFAHEGPIVRLAFTPDGSRLITTAEDRTVKVWETAGYTELKLWEREPDVPTALAVSGDGRSIRVGRLDGSATSYDLPNSLEAKKGPTSEAKTASGAAASPAEPKRLAEREPNETPAQAVDLELPAVVTGTISGRPGGSADSDLFRFHVRAGETWVVEVDAARSGSKLDSFVEVLDPEGRRVERAKLQAVRDSYFSFRGKDDAASSDFRLFNQDEMYLNQYLYANGEVLKLWLSPRGPDSGFVVYPGSGKRWGYFDTTPLTHALGEPCYVVEPHPPGSEILPNGLPVFTVYFDNDDESHRELGKDSKLFFTAPVDGTYLAKIRDVRGLEGADFRYSMAIRPSRPDFRASLAMARTTIGAGASQEFKVGVRRIDDYEGPVRVDVDGLPTGFFASMPLVIEAGQIEALGVIAARPDAPAPTPEQAKGLKFTASATIEGREVAYPLNPPGELKLADKPPLTLQILPAEGGAKPVRDEPGRPLEFEIHAGQTIELKVRVARNGHVGQVPLGNEGAGRNLPFGVIVDNIGLNGLLITESQDERTFYVTADRSATPQARPFHLTTGASGGQSSHPVLLHVR